MGIDYILDTSNQHPKIKNEDQLEEFLVYYKLFVDDDEFKLHGLIWAKDSEDAFNKMPEVTCGNNFDIMKGGVIGAVKDGERRNIHDKLHNLGGGLYLP